MACRGRECFIPTCKNDSANAPDKIIVRIREDLREKWCDEAKVEYFKQYTQYCCEDHFDPREDLQNYLQHKLINVELKLKPTALLRNITLDRSTDSTEVTKVLMEDPSTRKPTKRKPEDTSNIPSTSEYFTLAIKSDCSAGSPQSPSPPPKRRKRTSEDYHQPEFLDIDSTRNGQDPSKLKELSEFELTGMNITKKLSRMDPTQAIYAESIINNVIRKGLLKKLTEVTDLCDNVCGRILTVNNMPSQSLD